MLDWEGGRVSGEGMRIKSFILARLDRDVYEIVSKELHKLLVTRQHVTESGLGVQEQRDGPQGTGCPVPHCLRSGPPRTPLGSSCPRQLALDFCIHSFMGHIQHIFIECREGYFPFAPQECMFLCNLNGQHVLFWCSI